MKVVVTHKKDLKQIAQCHRSAFPESLSSQLGNWFCQKMLSWYFDSDRGVMIHVEENGKVLGYTGGIIIKKPGFPGAATSITQYSFWPFVFAFVLRPWLILHPENRKRYSFILRNIGFKLGVVKFSKPPVVFEPFQTRWGLVVIGVDPTARGKGIGSALLREFEEMAIKDGVELVGLTVKVVNKQAITVYENSGWLFERMQGDTQTMIKKLKQ